MSTSESSSDSSFEYEIKEFNTDCDTQFINLISRTRVFDDPTEVYNLAYKNSYQASSDDFIFAIASVVKFDDVRTHLNKKMSENIQKLIMKYKKMIDGVQKPTAANKNVLKEDKIVENSCKKHKSKCAPKYQAKRSIDTIVASTILDDTRDRTSTETIYKTEGDKKHPSADAAVTKQEYTRDRTSTETSQKRKNDPATIDDIQLLIYEKISNAPYTAIIDLLTKISEQLNLAIIISKCELLKQELDDVCLNFHEYDRKDLRYYPKKEEEVFFLQNNICESVFEVYNEFYRILLIDNKNYKKFIKLLKNDIK